MASPTEPVLARDARIIAALIGEELSAYLAGAGNPAQLKRWAHARDGIDRAPSYADRRIALVRNIAELFTSANLATGLRAWLREVDPSLDHFSPAQRIRQATDEFALDEVRAAAARFLGVKTVVSAPGLPSVDLG
jgi:hypothetical protein